MIRRFLNECTKPGGETLVDDLYVTFKRRPKTEGWRKARFLNEASHAGVQFFKRRGKWLAGLTLVEET